MAKPFPALHHLAFDEAQRKVISRYGKADVDHIEMDYLGFIARLTTHIAGGSDISGRAVI